MTWMRCWALLILSCCLQGCSDDEDVRPPNYSPVVPSDSLMPCDALRDLALELDGIGRIRVDAGAAACVPDGLQCTLGACDGGLGVATCWNSYWRWDCVASASAQDASVDVAGE